MNLESWIYPILAAVAAPFLFGVINRTKAFFAGRRGQPLLQPYFDIWKLLRKGAVYSRTTTWLFVAGPLLGLAIALLLLLLLPMGRIPALVAFPGDVLLLVYLFGLWRFFTMLAALDTGSSFEGMGASREAFFSLFAELPLILGVVALAAHLHSFSLSVIFGRLAEAGPGWSAAMPMLLLIGAAWFVVMLAENARMPVDDPNTHLELTMIHEVMILDHGGPDLAFILYASSLKFWIMGSLLVNLLVPLHFASQLINVLAFAGGMLIVAVLVGVVESGMARLRLTKVPQLLVGAAALSFVALLLVIGT
jgi:formate hydrogenlyase subunit 4